MAEVNMPRMGGPKVGGPARFRPGERAKDQKGTLKRILQVFLQFKGTVILAMVLTAGASGVSVAIPVFVGKCFNTFDMVRRQVDYGVLLEILALILALYVMNWVINTITSVTVLKVSQKLVYAIREEFFGKMQRLPLAFYDTTPRGDTMSRITNDVDTISSTIAQAATQLTSSALTLAGSFAVMVCLSIPLTLAVLLCVPLVFLLTKLIAAKSRAYFLAQQRSLGALNGMIEESIYGFKMVKAFSKEEDFMQAFGEVNEALRENGTKAQTWSGYMMPLMNVINNFTFACVAIVGGILCTDHGLLIGTVVSFLSYSKQFATPLNAVAGLFNTIQSALAGAERVFEIMDEAEETSDVPEALEAVQILGAVEFSHVNFSYDGRKRILTDISFQAEPGETIALVGETGSGKTTIVNLLTRFYDADSGDVLIDGINIRKMKRQSLRNCFSIVLQETCMFTGTIEDNIRYSKTGASREEVERAAHLAHAHEFIEKLPKGYDTVISGSADTLSEGQRQLIAIARAVLCDSPVLILDEATSSVDTRTEKNIQQAFRHLMSGRTSFIIAHRLSTIRDADRIVVIGDGEILEEGNHETLMERRGSYYRMVMSQTGLSKNLEALRE